MKINLRCYNIAKEMSDYIYGSSLRAAKSKANYLFEGDFRRRPNQNLSGASRSLATGELLQQAAEQRQNRQDTRKKEKACIKLQAVWRGYLCRKPLRKHMRETFDRLEQQYKSTSAGVLDEVQFDLTISQFILFFEKRLDEGRFDSLVGILLQNRDKIIAWKTKRPHLWFCRISRLLCMSLRVLCNSSIESTTKYLNFLEKFTQVPDCIDHDQALKVWKLLVGHDLYSILRGIVDKTATLNDNEANEKMSVLFEIVRRPLDVETSDVVSEEKIKAQLTYSFYTTFLRGPLDSTLDSIYFAELAKLKPKGLRPRYVLRAFSHLRSQDNGFAAEVRPSNQPSSNSNSNMKDCEEGVWLCYSFIRTIHTQLQELRETEKVDYINTLSSLMGPAETITNFSLMQATSSQDEDSEEPNEEEIIPSSMSNQVSQYNKQINVVISQITRIINEPTHVNALKPIIFSSELLRSQAQSAIIRVCNVMLNHEPLAIFNCRLLYTVAFSREFSKSLWKGIITTTNWNLFGASSPIYQQIIRGNPISDKSWSQILPQLRLFCSLYSYLLPTLDDEEFYTDTDSSFFKDTKLAEVSHGSHKAFLIDKDLVGISAVLKDICIGFVENLYQDNRHSWQYPNWSSVQHESTQRNSMLSFEIKQCFKALVRLIGQIHARDSRKRFCPEGHWICPSIMIPANKEINFQLITSQQGRLISKMTHNSSNTEVTAPVSANEIKIILILQEIPFVVSFQDRVQIFHQLLRKEKHIHQSDGYHFGLPGTAIQIQARRNYIYEDAFEKLSLDNEPNLKLPLKISLINSVGAEEAGVDGGGLTKEFLGELLKAGFDPMRGFFKSTKDNLLYPNPSANILFASITGGFEVHYEFLGRILGKAIFEKMMVELPLAGFFLAKLLARKHSSDVDLHNLASLDPVLYKNLVYLKNYKGDVSDLNLDFTISNNDLDEHEVVELKPNGSKIPVTHENKIEYVHLVADYRLNKQIRAQCAAFKEGLAQLIDLDWLRMFDPRELQILISGAPTLIDIDDWRRHTVYANRYTDDCEVVKTFWRVARRFDEDKKRKLLKFATSCSLPPLLGFKDLVPPFTIAPSEETRLPTASTCMNLLKLPECEDEETMQSKLLYAIESNSGFELS